MPKRKKKKLLSLEEQGRQLKEKGYISAQTRNKKLRVALDGNAKFLTSDKTERDAFFSLLDNFGNDPEYIIKKLRMDNQKRYSWAFAAYQFEVNGIDPAKALDLLAEHTKKKTFLKNRPGIVAPIMVNALLKKSKEVGGAYKLCKTNYYKKWCKLNGVPRQNGKALSHTITALRKVTGAKVRHIKKVPKFIDKEFSIFNKPN
jgi:hypothetical protein|tara:strand:- start:724 stop:1329 length:606 start_codon:yes stop_codon:yes gene_type:complete